MPWSITPMKWNEDHFIWRRTKGKRGEKTVAALLSLLPNKDYMVINDLVIQSGGYSTQIDHVVVSGRDDNYA